MKVRMKVEGGDKLARKLQMIAEEYQRKHMLECAVKSAEVIRQETEDSAPVGISRVVWSKHHPEGQAHDAGTLKDDIRKEVRKQTKSKVDVYVGPGKKAFYAYWVEMGHALVLFGKKTGKRVPPHPFLGPAFERKTDEAEQTFAKELKRRLRL